MNKNQTVILWLGTAALVVSVARVPMFPIMGAPNAASDVPDVPIPGRVAWHWVWERSDPETWAEDVLGRNLHDTPHRRRKAAMLEGQLGGKEKLAVDLLLAEWISLGALTGAALLTFRTKP